MMRDLIWTIIVIWFVYKLVEVFKSFSAKKQKFNSANPQHSTGKTTVHTANSDDTIKDALRKHVNKEGEYVDFEEVK
jgi:hypothetical protein